MAKEFPPHIAFFDQFKVKEFFTESEKSFYDTLDAEQKKAFEAAIAERVREKYELSHDAKSGLLRDHLYYQIMEGILEGKSEEELETAPVYINAFDMAYLSYFNEAAGHVRGGDEAVITVGEYLKQYMDKDSRFRWGGDEFITVTKDITEEQNNALLEHLKTDIKKKVIAHMPVRVDYASARIGEGLEALKTITAKYPGFVERSGKSRENQIALLAYDIADRRATIRKRAESLLDLLKMYKKQKQDNDPKKMELFINNQLNFMKKGAGITGIEDLEMFLSIGGKEEGLSAIRNHIRESMQKEPLNDSEKIIEGVISAMVDEQELDKIFKKAA